MAFLSLVPTESFSGEGRHQGSTTKTGNTHARRLLVEAAWHHRRPYRPTKTMRDRWDLAPAAARARGHAGNQRLHGRQVRFNERKKRPVIANVAVARELAGWCWSLAMLEDPVPRRVAASGLNGESPWHTGDLASRPAGR